MKTVIRAILKGGASSQQGGNKGHQDMWTYKAAIKALSDNQGLCQVIDRREFFTPFTLDKAWHMTKWGCLWTRTCWTIHCKHEQSP